MSYYQNFLFVGARGEYQNMPFEVLGNGQVDYTIKKAGTLDEQDSVGHTFPAIEYYCLANNGQTWYFAVSDDEVYYCRQLQKDEIDNLKVEMGAETFLVDSFLNNQYKISLVEYGLGKLNKAEGRALKDSREFAEFEYLDFKMGQKSYSIDIFPDNYQEWFETIWIPNNKLSEIFKDSLRLQNPEVKNIFETAKLWRNIGISAFVVAGLVLCVPIGLATQTKQIYDQKKELISLKDSEVIFENIQVYQPNKQHSLQTKIELPTNQGISLNFSLLDQSNQIISSGDQEYLNTTSDNTQTISTDFFPDKKDTFSLLVRVNDYGAVGSSTSSASNSISSASSSNFAPRVVDTVSSATTETATTAIPTKINLSVKVFEGSVGWFGWIFSSIFLILIGVGCLVYNNFLKGKAWLLNPKSTLDSKPK